MTLTWTNCSVCGVLESQWTRPMATHMRHKVLTQLVHRWKVNDDIRAAHYRGQKFRKNFKKKKKLNKTDIVTFF